MVFLVIGVHLKCVNELNQPLTGLVNPTTLAVLHRPLLQLDLLLPLMQLRYNI